MICSLKKKKKNLITNLPIVLNVSLVLLNDLFCSQHFAYEQENHHKKQTFTWAPPPGITWPLLGVMWPGGNYFWSRPERHFFIICFCPTPATLADITIIVYTTIRILLLDTVCPYVVPRHSLIVLPRRRPRFPRFINGGIHGHIAAIGSSVLLSGVMTVGVLPARWRFASPRRLRFPLSSVTVVWPVGIVVEPHRPGRRCRSRWFA